MPFTFAKGHSSLQGLFFMTFVFCQEPSSYRLCLQIIWVLWILEIIRLWWWRWGCWTNSVLIGIAMFVKDFWSTIRFIPGSSLRYSRRSFSFCDNPLALIFTEDDELFSFLMSCLLGVAGALAFSNKCKLCRVNLRLPCLQKNSTFSLPQSLVLNSGHHLIL